MKRNVVRSIFLACLFLTKANDLVLAATLNLPAIDRGWYKVVGQHTPSNTNYYVGDGRGPQGVSLDPGFAEFRNFFVFDLSSVVLPISSAKLALSLPRGGYISIDPSETYELHDVITPIDALLSGSGGAAAHWDLGNGAVYGSRAITPGDMETVLEINLSSAAIADLNATHSRFAIGGKLTTLDDLPNDEGMFGSTDSDTYLFLTELRLTLIPEPTIFSLFSIAAVMLGNRRLRTGRI